MCKKGINQTPPGRPVDTNLVTVVGKNFDLISPSGGVLEFLAAYFNYDARAVESRFRLSSCGNAAIISFRFSLHFLRTLTPWYR